MFYSCLKGVGSPTRCPEGLHYSEAEGICVWARDSGRDGCGVQPDDGEKRRRKKKKEPSHENPAPSDSKSPRTLENGFRCPGGKLGVHLSLPHPTSCRSYYVCLNGVEASQRGCSVGKVFNPDTSSCDQPKHVPGCENFYEKKQKHKVSFNNYRQNIWWIFHISCQHCFSSNLYLINTPRSRRSQELEVETSEDFYKY